MGAGAGKRMKNQKNFLELEHRKGKKNQNVDISLTKFASNVYRIGNRQKDLLEIAGYIFAADRKTYRGHPDDVEYHNWSRKFHFHFYVRDIEFWNQDKVKKLLADALCFMTGDVEYEFTFYKAEPDFPTDFFDNEDFEIEGKENLSVILFSGGIDSLAGTLEKINTTNDEICLVSHQSGVPSVKLTQRTLFEEINRIYPNRGKHYKFHCGLAKKKSKDETQRTRPFLFCSMAYAIASTYNQDNIEVYENGVTSINLPETQDLMNGRASRTTHPKTIGLLEKLFTEISGKEFKINHPFLFKTKTDVIELLKKNEGLGLLDSSVSCSRTFQKPQGKTHCGRCTQCVDRRFAVYANEVEKFDENGIYKFDFLRSPLTDDHTVKVLTEFIRFAQEVKDSDADWLYSTKTGEMFDLENFIDGDGFEEKIKKIYGLYLRHAEQVERAIQNMVKLYDKPFSRHNAKSLFRLIIGPKVYQIKQGTKKEEEIKVDEKVRKKDKAKIDDLVKAYIETCKQLNFKEPTLDNLVELTKYSKAQWDINLKKDTFWNLLNNELEHSFKQAKRPETKDFWISMQQIATDEFANLIEKKYRAKEKLNDDLPQRKRRSL